MLPELLVLRELQEAVGKLLQVVAWWTEIFFEELLFVMQVSTRKLLGTY
jgi:hypothetical protein